MLRYNMKSKQAIDILEKLNACKPALDHIRKYLEFKDAWQSCEEGDWLVWIAGKSGAYSKEKLSQIVFTYVHSTNKIERFHPESKVVRLYNNISLSESWVDDLCDILSTVKEGNSGEYFRNHLDYDKIINGINLIKE